MNRRMFLQGLGALVAGIAVEEAIPLGRVWSFPKKIRIANAFTDDLAQSFQQAYKSQARVLAEIYYNKKMLERFNANGFLSIAQTPFITPDRYAQILRIPIQQRPLLTVPLPTRPSS